MSEATTPTRRIGTRAVVRQENSAMAETESPPTEAASSQTVTTLESPKLEVKVVPKEEPQPEPVETPAVPVTTASTLTLITTALPVTTSLTSSPTTNTVNTTAAAVQMKDSSFLLQPLGFTHRKRKANFSNEETETLVKYVVKHFSALYGSEALRTESTRRNQRRSQLWNQIQRHVNELGYTPRSIDDLKHKWRDLRLEVKRKITHRKTANKTPSTAAAAATTATATPIIDTKLNPLEEQVASTIGHHCSLDGEQEGLYIEPGVPRQSIFFNCRGSPGAPMPDLGMDKLGTGSPRPTVDLSLMSSLVSNSPAQLSFVLSEDGDNEDMDVTPSVARTAAPTVAPVVAPAVTIKPFPDTWTAVKDLGALVTTPNILSAPQTILTALPQIFTVKQEVVTTQPLLAPARCESQSSMVSSPEGSVSNVTTPAEWNGDSAAVSLGSIEMVKLKEEDEDGDSQGTGKKSPLPESQDEWEGQSASPQPSDNAPEDSLPSTSSQDGDPPSGTDLPTNDNCSCDTGGKDEVKAKMQRLLELEERWDRMYDQELGIWEEERTRQQQQRNQDRELQQQLLGVLTDIRDELRQLREERAAARQNETAANGPLAAPKVEKSPKKAAVTPKAAANQRPPPSGKRRGRPPRINKPVPEPARPIRPAPGHSSKS